MHLRLYSYNVNTAIRLASKRCFNNDNNNNNKYNNCVELFVCFFFSYTYILSETRNGFFLLYSALLGIFYYESR